VKNKLKIILLSPYLPAVNTTGCARKVFDCIRLLHQKGHRVYLLSFCSKHDELVIDAVRPYCAQLHLERIKDYLRYPDGPNIFKDIIRLLYEEEGIDILQCEMAYMSKYIPENIKVVSVLTEHEVLSVSFLQKARLEINPIKKIILFARRIKKYFEEKAWYGKFNKVIVFSEEDKLIIRKVYNMKNVAVIPLGINLKDYSLRQKKVQPFDVIFVGNFSHYPNVDAVIFFYKEILPLIRGKLSCVTSLVVGANPPRQIRKLAELNKNISITGYVEDIAEYYSKSKVFIAPIRCGTGMSFKLLEALALKMPIVTTSIGARGFIHEDNIKIADTKREFADRVVELLNDPDKRDCLAEKARRTVEKYYDWNDLLDRYENIYYNLLTSKSS